MNNKMIKLFALTATLLVATQPLAAMWEEEAYTTLPSLEEVVDMWGVKPYTTLSAQEELTQQFCDGIKNNDLGDLETIKQIIREYPDLVNAKNKDGKTPLHIAVEEGNLEIVKLLLEYGADSNARDNACRPPLMLAAFAANNVDHIITYLQGFTKGLKKFLDGQMVSIEIDNTTILGKEFFEKHIANALKSPNYDPKRIKQYKELKEQKKMLAKTQDDDRFSDLVIYTHSE